MTVVLVTIQRGRHGHLRRQLRAVARGERRPDAHVVVSMDDEPPTLPGCDVIHLPMVGQRLPLAAARNAGIARAERRHGADVVVLLDVDCLPSPSLVGRYETAQAVRPDALLAGAVWYLPPGVPSRGALPGRQELAGLRPHPARPVAPPGTLLPEPRTELFWSLSFAVAPALHARIGGFDEGYRGYGAEDTDYARRAAQAQVELVWVGGGDAFHLHHPVSSPPVEHLADIVRNARRFRERWGDWPMEGWLAAFRDLGLIAWSEASDHLELTPSGLARAVG